MVRRGSVLLLGALVACGGDDPAVVPPQTDVVPTRITFGSCSDPRAPMPLLEVAASLEPDLHVWLGDNVYADTEDPDVMRVRYQELSDAPEAQALAAVTPFASTWDDHDYGENDAGSAYPMRETAQQIFLEHWGEPADSPRWDQAGIHTAWRFDDGTRVLQLIALDTRYHRDPLTLNDGSGLNDYIPNTDTSRTLLGEAQWAWLEERLLEPADLRVIASSIQLAHAYNGYESWTLFPHERERLLQLIVDTQAEGVLALSGDVHWGEVSSVPIPGGYTLHDVTSSGINQDWPFVSENGNRVAGPVIEHNVGLLRIDWAAGRVDMSLHDGSGAVQASHAVSFDDLRF